MCGPGTVLVLSAASSTSALKQSPGRGGWLLEDTMHSDEAERPYSPPWAAIFSSAGLTSPQLPTPHPTG